MLLCGARLVSSVLLAVVFLTTGTASAEVTAARLDGVSLAGVLQYWADGSCVLATSSGERKIPETELLSLQWAPAPSAADTSQPMLELVDGSILPLEEYRASNETADLILHNSGPRDERTTNVPLDQIRAAWLQPIDKRLAGQRDEIRELTLPSDLLVIFKQNGKSLDYLEGVVGEITDAEVEFTLDGKTMRVQRSKVAGVVYYRGDQAAGAAPACVLLGRDGLDVNASQVRMKGDGLEFETAGPSTLTWPLADIYKADFSAGKLVFLSDLEPAVEQWSPWIGLPKGATLAAKYGQPHRDEASAGGPLSLWIPGESPADSGREQSFDKGLSLRSRSVVSYRLPRGFSRFLAEAGIEPTTNHNGDVSLTIDGDGRQLWSGRIAGGQGPQSIDAEIDGVKRLTIVVDYGDNLDTGDWLNLCNARIVK